MKDKEKTKEIATNRQFGENNGYIDTYLIAYDAAMAMASWKNQKFTEEKKQLIEKACEWLKDWLLDENAGVLWKKSGVEELVNDFKKAMEEQK